MKKLILAIAATFCAVSAAQVPGTGAYNHVTLDSPGFDQVNVGNLNTRFTIPIVNKQGRGLPFNYVIQYEGLVWQPVNNGTTTTWVPNTNWGFNGQLNGNGVIGYLTHSTSTIRCGGAIQQGQPLYYETFTSGYAYHDPFGAVHGFNYMTSSGCAGAYDPSGPSTTGNGASTDGSGYTLVNGRTLQTSNGITIVPSASPSSGASSETDANGNEITFNGSGAFTDTTGTNELTISGSNPVQFTYPVTLQANSSSSAAASLYYKSYTVQSNFGCSGVVEYGSNTAALVDHITLADGETYSFTYESTPGVSGAVTGRLASIKLPTSGVIQYTYQNGSNGINCADGTTEGLVRTTTDGIRTYSRPAPSQPANTTLLTDERGKQSYWWFSIDSLGQYEATHRRAHDGTASGTNLLEEDITCYNSASQSNGTCDGQAITQPIIEADTSTTYNYVPTPALTKNTYDATGHYLAQSSVYNGSTLLMSTLNSYYTNPSSVTELMYIKTTDGSGNTVAYTGYGYDETTLTATSSLPQHGAASSYPGNQTSVSVSIDGTTTNTLKTTTAYYDTGMPVSTTAPGSFKTMYGYDSTGTFQTSTTLPTPSSGVGLSTSATFDAASGAATSATGMNSGQTFTMTRYDALLRPMAVATPNQGSLGQGLTDATYSPNEVDTSTAMNSSQSTFNKTFLDSYGRTVRAAVQSSSGWYVTDYCYTNGVLQAQSTPYLSASATPSSTNCSSSNATQYTVDGLGRATQISTPDGNTVTKNYNGRAVKIVNANGPTKIIQQDLLGRISAVCEVVTYSQDAGGNTTAACQGLDIAGSGFTTTYGYNLAGHTVTITQGAQSRVFTTDYAGRTTSVTEPESGLTTYSYAYTSSGLQNTSGLQVVRTRPRANQANASVTTATTTQFDSIGRLTDVFYTDGTPSKNYSYDLASGNALGNRGSSKGLVTGLSTYTNNGSFNLINARGYAYDIMGRVSATDDCLTGWCGSMGDVFRYYSYDLASNLTNDQYATGLGNNGMVRTVNTYNIAGQLTNVLNAQNSLNLYTATPGSMQPGGAQAVTFGNNLTAFTQYDSMDRAQGRWLCSQPGGNNCPNSTYYYGYYMTQVGNHVTSVSDTAVNRYTNYFYDQMGNLTSSSTPQGYNGLNFSAGYDRYGNRWSETVSNTPSGSGPNQTLSFKMASNQVQGFTYDAAGNLMNDGQHTYQYDAENNLITIDNGGTAQYWFDALTQRDASSTSAGVFRYGFDVKGRRATTWASSGGLAMTQFYNDSGALGYWSSSDGNFHYEHQDWIGTERMRTNQSAAIEGTYASLPFGEPNATSGNDLDGAHFTGLDEDGSFSATSLGLHHAMFREYNSTQGRWMSPDPYSGSYQLGDPQSFNRYSYVLNNPLSATDPNGQQCVWDDGSFDSADDPDTGAADLCAAQGGSYISPGGAWDSLGVSGDWSSQANQDLATVANDLNSSNTVVNVNADGSGSIYQNAINLYNGVPYLVTTSSVWNLSLSQKQILAIANAAPTICGGGVFGYGGRSIDAGPATGFAGGVVEADTQSGVSKGALFEAGGGEGYMGGGGTIVSNDGGGLGSANLAYGGVGVAVPGAHAGAGLVGFTSGIGAYGEVSAGGREVGVGAYLNITTNAGCLAK